MARRKKQWSASQLDILYECWKSAENNKERIKLIEEKLPNIPPLAALNKMRILSKTDPKWVGMVTRKKNQKVKLNVAVAEAKLKRQEERRLKKELAEQKRKERQLRKEEKEKHRTIKSSKEFVRQNLTKEDIKEVIDSSEFFFCSSAQHFVNDKLCVFRIFSEEYGAPIGPPCDKCNKMDKYLSILEEHINGRQNSAGSNKTSKRCKITKEA